MTPWMITSLRSKLDNGVNGLYIAWTQLGPFVTRVLINEISSFGTVQVRERSQKVPKAKNPGTLSYQPAHRRTDETHSA